MVEQRTVMQQKCKSDNRGGKRTNAGRKPQADGQGRSVAKSIKVSKGVADYLTAHGTGLIEDLIRRSKAFREWKK